jgi:hypothetical protein
VTRQAWVTFGKSGEEIRSVRLTTLHSFGSARPQDRVDGYHGVGKTAPAAFHSAPPPRGAAGTVTNVRGFDMSSATTVLQPAPGPTPADDARTPDIVGLLDSIVASAEPAVVFSSVVQLCAPQICSSVAAAISEAGECTYTVVNPPGPRPELGGLDNADAIVVFGGTRVARTSTITDIRGPATAQHCAFDGVLVMGFAQPGPAHALLAQLVVDRAVEVIARERRREIAERRQPRGQHLTATQRTSRDIGIALGIVMTRYELGEADAFDLLHMSSLDTDRRICEVARDVAHSGRFDIPGRVHAAGRDSRTDEAGNVVSLPLRAPW